MHPQHKKVYWEHIIYTTDNIEGFIVLAGSRARFYVYKAILSVEMISTDNIVSGGCTRFRKEINLTS